MYKRRESLAFSTNLYKTLIICDCCLLGIFEVLSAFILKHSVSRTDISSDSRKPANNGIINSSYLHNVQHADTMVRESANQTRHVI